MSKKEIKAAQDVWLERCYHDKRGTQYPNWSLYRRAAGADSEVCLAITGLVWRSADEEHWRAAVYWLAEFGNPSHSPANQKCPALFMKVEDAMRWCEWQIHLGHPALRETEIHAMHA